LYSQYVFFAILFFILANKFREINEYLFIRRELKREGLIALVIVVLNSVVSFILLDFSLRVAKTALDLLYVTSETVYALVIPLRQSYYSMTKPLPRENIEVSVASITMEELLKSPRVRQAFALHLTREFSVENLIFVLHVEEFKRMNAGNVKSVFEEACRIYTLFVQPEALYEVNLPATVLSHLVNEFSGHTAPLKQELGLTLLRANNDLTCINLTKLERIEVIGSPERSAQFYLQVFDRAYDDMMCLLRNDSFVRFCKSDLFLQLNIEKGTGDC